MPMPRATSNEADELAATIASLKSRLNELESMTIASNSGEGNIGRNIILNGAFDIKQRRDIGESQLTTNSVRRLADGWQLYRIGTLSPGSNSTVERVASTLIGFDKMLDVTIYTSFTATYHMAQSFETVDVVKHHGQFLTLSFWAKGQSSGTLTAEIFGGIGTDGNVFSGFTSQTTLLTGTASLTSTFQRFTFTMPAVLSSVIKQLGVRFTYDPNINPDKRFFITGIQLERGKTATSYAAESFSEALRRCQRYYYLIRGADVGDYLGVGFNRTSTTGLYYTPFPVPMRVEPTALEQYYLDGFTSPYGIAYANTSAVTNAAPLFASATVNGAASTATVASGLTAGQGSMLRANLAGAWLAWSAEL